MPNYRRRYAPAGTFFFSVMLDPKANTTLTEHLGLLRHAYAQTVQENPVETLAIVILPDHLHAVWRLPAGDANYPLRWNKIKRRFSRAFDHGTAGIPRPSHRTRRERAIWQRRYWEHQIRDRDDLMRHLAYCWSDPVRHGLVASPADWHSSSFHREVRAGQLPPDWTTGPIEGTFGERQIHAEEA